MFVLVLGLLACVTSGTGDSAAAEVSDVPEVDVEVPAWPECPGLVAPFAFESAAAAWGVGASRSPDLVALVAGLASAESEASAGCPAWVTEGPVETMSGDCTASGGATYAGSV